MTMKELRAQAIEVISKALKGESADQFAVNTAMQVLALPYGNGS